MTTFFLRFPDESTAQTVLAAVGLYSPETDNRPGFYNLSDKEWDFDPIGAINLGCTLSPETGEELEPPTVLVGWHANYKAETLPPELKPYNLDPPPKRPMRVFA